MTAIVSSPTTPNDHVSIKRCRSYELQDVTNTKRRRLSRRVHFCPMADIIPKSSNDHEYVDTWLHSEDYHYFRTERMYTCYKLSHGQPLRPEKYCTTGLDAVYPRHQAKTRNLVAHQARRSVVAQHDFLSKTKEANREDEVAKFSTGFSAIARYRAHCEAMRLWNEIKRDTK